MISRRKVVSAAPLALAAPALMRRAMAQSVKPLAIAFPADVSSWDAMNSGTSVTQSLYKCVFDTMLDVSTTGPFAPGVGLQAYGGAIADVPEDDTAFSHRDTMFELGASTSWTDPAEDADRMATARAYAATLDQFASGVYVNVLNDEGASGVRRAYSPAKLQRLTAVKDAYDPENVFHLNQNIPPSRTSGQWAGRESPRTSASWASGFSPVSPTRCAFTAARQWRGGWPPSRSRSPA